jgi:hypothetical protein
MCIDMICRRLALAVSSSTLLLVSALPNAYASWSMTQVLLTESGPPDITSTSNAKASCLQGIRFGVDPPHQNDAAYYNYVHTNAFVSTQGYTSASAHIYQKTKIIFTWVGAGTPTSHTIQYQKQWTITPVSSGSSLVGLYATGSYDGVALTAASGTTGWTNGFLLNSSNTSLIYSCGSNSMSGYSYGGPYERKSELIYSWDVGGIIP